MKIREIEKLAARLFRKKWERLHGDAFSDPALRFPGVYLLAYSKRDLAQKPVEERDVLYVGMSNAQGGVRVRLKQFRDGIEKNDLHSGARRFYREYQSNRPWSKLKGAKSLFYAAISIECVSEKSKLTPADLRKLGHVCCLEYYVIARVREKAQRMPPLNKFGKRPSLKTK
jgi:hypothetical protein